MIAAEAAGVPWSLTVHRWDIAEDNLLARKARSACFVRSISKRGAAAVESRTDTQARVLRLGVEIGAPPAAPVLPAPGEPLCVVTPANLVAVKGHRFLLDAVRLLLDRGVQVELELAGEGELRAELEARVRQLGFGDAVRLLGRLSHTELLEGLRAGRWHVVALPSVIHSEDEQEGVPVALVEALAAGVPALGTESGGIPELLGDGAGLLVPPADAAALAEALASIAADPEATRRRVEAGRLRVEQEYDVEVVAGTLADWAAACG
jgi:glycosyltransferase involved in cell wall biosynthesis